MKYFINIIAIIVVVLLVLGAIQFKSSDTYYYLKSRVEYFFQRAKNYVEVKKHNIGMETAPKRKAPLTFIVQEETLRRYIPHVFGKFDQQEWNEFWGLIYEPIKEKQGFFKVKRYRSKSEIESYLKNHYPDPFTRFRESNWYDFWNIANISWE